MNRLFGTKKKEEPKIVQPVVEEKKIDLVEQAKKVLGIDEDRKPSERDRRQDFGDGRGDKQPVHEASEQPRQPEDLPEAAAGAAAQATQNDGQPDGHLLQPPGRPGERGLHTGEHSEHHGDGRFDLRRPKP